MAALPDLFITIIRNDVLPHCSTNGGPPRVLVIDNAQRRVNCNEAEVELVYVNVFDV